MTLRIDATELPSGTPRTFWVRDGHITFTPQPDATPWKPPGGFVAVGLVDAHTHADFPQEPVADRDAFVRRNLRQFSAAGVLLIRDLGASARTLESLPPAPGEPRVIPAGEALIGCANHCFPITAPDALVAHAAAQIRAGVQWVKIFTDWPDPAVEEHHKSTFFGEENPLTYAPEVLRRMVAEVHAQGGKVASHAFTHAGAQASIEAGADTIEHGWGLDEAQLHAMAARGIAWVPLVAIGAPMMQLATKDGRPGQRAWIAARLARMAETLPRAVSLGVPVLTGSDWFPMIGVADEITTLVSLGLAPSEALACATTTPRRFFGAPALEEGAPADLVWYAAHPWAAAGFARSPDAVLVGGVTVHPSPP